MSPELTIACLLSYTGFICYILVCYLNLLTYTLVFVVTTIPGDIRLSILEAGTGYPYEAPS